MKNKVLIFLAILILAGVLAAPSCNPSPTPPPTPPAPVMVAVDVCSATGLLPNDHCRKQGLVVSRQFEKGKEPTAICSVHKRPAQSALLMWSAYNLFDYTPAQIEAFMKGIDLAGGGGTEIFLTHTWPHDPMRGNFPTGWVHSTPFKQIGTWTDPKFPGYNFPLLDLDQWDDAYWLKADLVFQLALKYDLTLKLYILDACSWDKAEYKRCYFMDAAKQNGEHGGTMTGGRYEETETDAAGHHRVRWWYRKLIDRLVERATAAGGPKVIWGVMNEPSYINASANQSEDEQDRLVVSLHRFFYSVLKGHGVADDHVLICAGRAFEKMRADATFRACLFEVHGVNSPETLNDRIAKWGVTRMIFDGDGGDPKAAGACSHVGSPTCNMSAAQFATARSIMLTKGVGFYGTYDRQIEASWPIDIARVDFTPFRSLTGY